MSEVSLSWKCLEGGSSRAAAMANAPSPKVQHLVLVGGGSEGWHLMIWGDEFGGVMLEKVCKAWGGKVVEGFVSGEEDLEVKWSFMLYWVLKDRFSGAGVGEKPAADFWTYCSFFGALHEHKTWNSKYVKYQRTSLGGGIPLLGYEFYKSAIIVKQLIPMIVEHEWSCWWQSVLSLK